MLSTIAEIIRDLLIFVGVITALLIVHPDEHRLNRICCCKTSKTSVPPAKP